MKKSLIFIAIVVAGLGFCFDYFSSESFQNYADRTGHPWTCLVNIWIGKIDFKLGKYRDAYDFFSRGFKHCPNSEAARDARYKMADCLVAMQNPHAAVAAYEKFAEEYKGTQQAAMADNTAKALRKNF